MREKLNEFGRWLHDEFFSHDEHNEGNPKGVMKELRNSMANLTPEERNKQLQHITSYVDYYYGGIHSMRTPHDVARETRQLGESIARLNTVDAARETLERLGGAPTRETIRDAVERSLNERSRDRQNSQPTAEKIRTQERTAEPPTARVQQQSKAAEATPQRAHDHSASATV